MGADRRSNPWFRKCDPCGASTISLESAIGMSERNHTRNNIGNVTTTASEGSPPFGIHGNASMMQHLASMCPRST